MQVCVWHPQNVATMASLKFLVIPALPLLDKSVRVRRAGIKTDNERWIPFLTFILPFYLLEKAIVAYTGGGVEGG